MIVIQVKILVMETPVVHWFIARAIKKENPGIRLELSALEPGSVALDLLPSTLELRLI